ncbi:MAG: hypothetical protein K2X56_15970 [Mycobacterium pseudokansasii]|uniref:hypothetical protein n=1 Tax=Mycobacterium pseudokansasii TaxID=2341080 RepID=UPI0023F4A23A|nr:hypothetical protein [Mycobacterium pseudokansasii]MBY0389551.1 hypothetical protein [Mycobacterium pseudokansasii]
MKPHLLGHGVPERLARGSVTFDMTANSARASTGASAAVDNNTVSHANESAAPVTWHRRREVDQPATPSDQDRVR